MSDTPTAGTVHVWRIPLDVPVDTVRSLAPVLDATETARAERLRPRAERDRFVVSHAALRSILGRCLDRPPASLRFDGGEHGRPRLRDDGGTVRFSLSHSGECAVVAVAVDADVGADIERIRTVPRLLQIARRFFSPDEHDRLCEVPIHDRLRAFFDIWTRKEAFLKAVGRGIGGGRALGRFDVRSIGVAGETAVLDGDRVDLGRWTVRALEIDLGRDTGYVGAVVADTAGGFDIELRDWHLPTDDAMRSIERTDAG